MPAFILISGYLVGKKGIENLNGEWIKRRVISIGMPYMIWLCVLIWRNEHCITPIMIISEILGGGDVCFLRCLLLMDCSAFLIAQAVKMLSKKIKLMNAQTITAIAGGYFMGEHGLNSFN